MASTTDDKQKKKKKDVSRKTHRSIIRGMDDDRHAYILDLMRKNRLLQREAIYLNGTFYAERGYYPSYETAYETISGTDAYKALNTDIAQATLKTLYDSYKTTYEHWKNGDKNARVPRQKSPRKPLTIAFTNRVAVNAEDGTILIPGKQNHKVPGETKEEEKARTERWKQEKEWRRIPLPADLTDEEVAGITEIRLVPRMGGDEIELQLVIEIPVPEDVPKPKTVEEATRAATVDPGLDNLMTCTAFNLIPGEEDVLGTRIYDGRELKSRNQLVQQGRQVHDEAHRRPREGEATQVPPPYQPYVRPHASPLREEGLHAGLGHENGGGMFRPLVCVLGCGIRRLLMERGLQTGSPHGALTEEGNRTRIALRGKVDTFTYPWVSLGDCREGASVSASTGKDMRVV